MANSSVITGHSLGVRGRPGRGTGHPGYGTGRPGYGTGCPGRGIGYPGDRAVMKMPVHAADRPRQPR